MKRPAVLTWQRSLGRVIWTGLLGALGIIIAVVGWVGMLAGQWAGAAAVLGGVALLVVSELAARRYRQVTTAGLRWQRTLSSDDLAWQMVTFSTTQSPSAPGDAPDTVLVHHGDRTWKWPEPRLHAECVQQIGWWQRAQREFPYGDHRAVPGLYQNLPRPPREARRVHPAGRRVWQGVLAVLCTGTALVLAMLAIVNVSDPPVAAGWLLGAVLAGAGAWVSLRNAASRVWIHPDRIEQRRWFARRVVPLERVSGSYVAVRPYVVGLGFLAAVGTVVGMFTGSGSASIHDELNNQQVPTLLMRDGTAVPLRALTSRSTARAHRMAGELVT